MEVITKFMQDEYSITPPEESLEILVDAGLKFSRDEGWQFRNLDNTQRNINGRGYDSLVARVFSLAFPYEYVLALDNAQTQRWSAWLGTAEYRLGKLIKEQKTEERLFTKGLEHLLVSRQKGDNSKENAGLIGKCYFEMERYEEGISEYEVALHRARRESFDQYWMHTFDHALENAFELAVRGQERIQSPFFTQFLYRFQEFYNDFVKFWKQNDPERNVYFKLMFDGDYKPIDRIGTLLEAVSS